jgi:pilus assembly protein CpaB
LAVVAAIAAVLTGVSAAAPTGPPTIRVVRATSQLAAGSVVSAQDVAVSDVAEDAVPNGALVDPAAVINRRVLGPVAEGQVLTQLHVFGRQADVYPGHVVAPLRIPDPEVAALLEPGSRIDVIAADPDGGTAKVVANDVKVLTIPPPRSAEADRTPADGALILVEVDERTATVLAEAAAATRISLVLH